MNNATTHDARGSDELLATLDISRVRRRTTCGGTWGDGTMAGHRFNALVFAGHADLPEWELADSRIAKLWVQRLADRRVVANFDRGWDVEPADGEAADIVDLLAAGLADAICQEDPS